MTSDQLKAWVTRHGPTKTLACQALGLGRPTLDRYLAGSVRIPKVVALACAAIDHGITLENNQ
jgi:hypothetical protein